jgi:hypothetical protein
MFIPPPPLCDMSMLPLIGSPVDGFVLPSPDAGFSPPCPPLQGQQSHVHCGAGGVVPPEDDGEDIALEAERLSRTVDSLVQFLLESGSGFFFLFILASRLSFSGSQDSAQSRG